MNIILLCEFGLPTPDTRLIDEVLRREDKDNETDK